MATHPALWQTIKSPETRAPSHFTTLRIGAVFPINFYWLVGNDCAIYLTVVIVVNYYIMFTPSERLGRMNTFDAAYIHTPFAKQNMNNQPPDLKHADKVVTDEEVDGRRRHFRREPLSMNLYFVGLAELRHWYWYIQALNYFPVIDVERGMSQPIKNKVSGAWIVGAGMLVYTLHIALIALILLRGLSGADFSIAIGNVVILFRTGAVSIFLTRRFARARLNLEEQLSNQNL